MLVGGDHHQIVVVVTAGGGNQLGIRRRPELEVVNVELQTGRSIVGEAEGAEGLPFNSFRHPGQGRLVAVRHPVEGHRCPEALTDKSGSHQLLWCTSSGSPRSTLLSVRRHVM